MFKTPAFFFQCPKCKTWRYVLKRIEKIKCIKCGYKMKFSEIEKQTYILESLADAPKMLQRIKMESAIEKDPTVKREYDYMYGDR